MQYTAHAMGFVQQLEHANYRRLKKRISNRNKRIRNLNFCLNVFTKFYLLERCFFLCQIFNASFKLLLGVRSRQAMPFLEGIGRFAR